MMIALRAKNKLGFIEEALKKPNITTGANPMELQALEIVNLMVSSWILNVINPNYIKV